MRRLVVLRHGQTDYNVANRAQGHLDVPLNDVGRAQAHRVAPVLAAYAPTFVRSSDLSRARETAEVVAAACDLPVSTDPRLREFSVGDNREGLTWDEYATAFPEEIALHEAGRGSEVPGWETPEDVLARSLPALREAAEAVPEGGTGLVVAHGAVLRTLVPAFVGVPELGLALGAFDNCGFAVLDDTVSGLLPVAGGGGWRIRAWNRVAELGPSAPLGAPHSP
ncbi:MAG: histidine phosphatase family protein [Nocardioides sp.]|uniref:histidine phosphatase family protein n=1 Tax=Nocardioides sp. TaxID=35761 RepID=UPI003F09D087